MRYITVVAFCFIYFLTSAQDSLNVTALYNWREDTIVSASFTDNAYNEIWGYAKGGKEYAIIGTTLGTHIFDVTDAANSKEVVYVPGKHQGTDIIHRDYHDYKGYLYVVSDEGASSLQIIDLHFLPDSAPVVYDSDTLIRNSHNIFIDTLSGRLYTCGGISKRKGIQGTTTNHFSVISLDNPLEPELMINCSVELPFWTTIGYVHDAYVRNDTAYCNAGTEGLFVVDFSDTSNVQLIGSLTQYAQKGYNHSGWLSEDGKTYALADETWGLDLKILDVSDLSDIEVTDTAGSNIHEFSIVHNLILKGNYLYVSHYYDGLYIFDVSDKHNVKLAGYYDTSTRAHTDGKWEGAWGVYPFLPSGKILLSDMQTGLWVFDASKATSLDDKTLTQQDSNFEVFPNPFNELIYIKSKNDGQFKLTDSFGKEILSGNIEKDTEFKLHLEEKLPVGIYFLSIKDQRNTKVRKVIKSK